jgi:hypothetical protein
MGGYPPHQLEVFFNFFSSGFENLISLSVFSCCFFSLPTKFFSGGNPGGGMEG